MVDYYERTSQGEFAVESKETRGKEGVKN